jgi:hypothetical protein
MRKQTRLPLLFLLILTGLAGFACAPAEDPEVAGIRTRLKEPAALAGSELTRTFDQIAGMLGDRAVHFTQGSTAGELNREQRSIVLGMLTDRAGVFDEGLRTDGERALRVFNAPGTSIISEYDATRRLLIDVETLLPARFEFTDTASSEENYAFELTVGR